MTTYPPSSQAGLATFFSAGPGAPVIRRPLRAPCVEPGCTGHLTMTRVRSSIDGDPTWRESCDTCPYELEL